MKKGNDLAKSLTGWVLQQSDLVDYMGLDGEMIVSVVLARAFNFFEEDRDQIKKDLRKNFNLELSGSYVNFNFSRYMRLIW